MCIAWQRDDGNRLSVAGPGKDLEAVRWRNRYWCVCRRLGPHCFDWPGDWTLLRAGSNPVGALVQEDACDGAAFVEAACQFFATVGVDQVEVSAPHCWGVCCVRLWHCRVRQCSE